MFGLLVTSGSPDRALVAFCLATQKTAAATAATKRAEDDGRVRVQVQVLQGGWNQNGCDGHALPACTAGCAGYGCDH
jgi:hypothetical protein